MKTAVIYDKWLSGLGGGEVVACTMARMLKDEGWKVIFITGKYVHLHKIRDAFGIDLKDVEFYEVWNNEQRIRELAEGKDLFINLSFMDYSYGYARKNIYYVHFPTKERTGLFNIILLFLKEMPVHALFPAKLKERLNDRLRAGVFPNQKRRLDSYQKIITHSEYVKAWVAILWRKEAQIIYPPVNLLSPPKTRKKNWISSVGRFFTLGHGKKQEVMVKAFKNLYDKGYRDWQLHLVGGLGREPSSVRFMEDLRKTSRNYPVFFHVNATRKELEEILLASKIYWHAAGYGENGKKDPIKLEHFGIAPIEAISTGCRPVLFDGGGLREIVHLLGLSPQKHLFSTIDELVAKTEALVTDHTPLDPETHKKLNLTMSREAFEKRFLNLISS
jgi:glycosyltransferase involved in cell wall biosynthesis